MANGEAVLILVEVCAKELGLYALVAIRYGLSGVHCRLMATIKEEEYT